MRAAAGAVADAVHASRAGAVLMLIGGLLLATLAFAAVAAPLIAPYDPDEQAATPFAEPSREHLLGADDLGQDLLSALLYGARVSLFVGVSAALTASLLATGVGLFSGFLRGWLDAVLMRSVDIVLALPLLPLLLVLSAFLAPGPALQALIIGLILAPRSARAIRAQVLTVSHLGPVESAAASGAGALYLLRRHVLPATIPVIVSQFVRAVAVAVVLESSLSFLGLGDPTARSWGTTLFFASARGASTSHAWLWWVLPPGVCIGLTVVAFAFIGFGLEERSDPRLRTGSWRLRGARRSRGGRAAAPVAGAPLLVVNSLTIDYGRRGGVRALDAVSLTLEAGALMALVGPSGSGKSTLAAAILGMVRTPGRITSGQVAIEGRNLADLSAEEQRRLRGNRVALVPQAAMNALNPVVAVVDQVVEAVRVHQRLGRSEARARARELLATVGLAPDRANAFPHELSGGMRQRVAIAMAIANDPRLIVADEPTTGLDVVAQAEILELLLRIRARSGAAMIMVTHDRPAMVMRSARVIALAAGRLVEPHEPRVAIPEVSAEREDAPRRVAVGSPLLQITDLRKSFPRGSRGHRTEVLKGVDLRVDQAEIVGLIGCSGVGKTTLARVIAGLTRPDSGRVTFNGIDLLALPGRRQRCARRDLQMVGQDPYGWLSPRMSVRQLVSEPLVIHGVSIRDGREERVKEALADVGLQPISRYIHRFPHELSGGERQRVAFARAIVLAPALIVADEPASMLDADLREELIQLLEQLRRRRQVAFLCITHDVRLARAVCDRIVVMDDGWVVEECDPARLEEGPHHPATQRLLDAARVLGGAESLR